LNVWTFNWYQKHTHEKNHGCTLSDQAQAFKSMAPPPPATATNSQLIGPRIASRAPHPVHRIPCNDRAAQRSAAQRSAAQRSATTECNQPARSALHTPAPVTSPHLQPARRASPTARLVTLLYDAHTPHDVLAALEARSKRASGHQAGNGLLTPRSTSPT